MIILTKTGGKNFIPLLTAYDGAVFCYQFNGENRFIDPYDGSTWNWFTDNTITEVVGVADDTGLPLITAASIADCKTLDGTFYWSNADGVLYVHWNNSVGDHSVNRSIAIYSKLKTGYASGWLPLSQNVFDGVYYQPLIIDLAGLSKKVDPLEFGLVAFSASSVTMTNEAGEFDDILESDAANIPIIFYYVPDDALVLTDAMKIFSGFINGTQNNREKIVFKVIETRLYENKPICQNYITLTDYPDCDDQEGELIPVAFGDIRRGIMIPIDLGAITDPPADPTTITFLVADPDYYSVIAIDKVYDQDGNEFPIDSVSLANNTVTITSDDSTLTVDEFIKLDFTEWSWEGKGFDIDGTYNNGLDIIRACFLTCADVPYIATTFDLAQWALETTAHPQPIGISVQSDGGFIEQIIQPVTVSLYGYVDILGDGRISFRSRDITNPVGDTIEKVDQTNEPAINIDPQKCVSELYIKYSPNFVDDEKYLSYVYDALKDQIITLYGINRRDPISPVETVLVNKSDVEDYGALLMETIGSPEKQITVEALRMIDLPLLSILGINIGKNGATEYAYGEIIEFSPKYLTGIESVTIRTIDAPVIESPPSIPLLLYAYESGYGRCLIEWRPSSVGVVTGYKLLATTNPPDWDEIEIDYTVLDYDPDGNLFYQFTGLIPGRKYYFRVCGYNSVGDSPMSNYIDVDISTVADNAYRLTGDIYDAGMSPDQTNPYSGTALPAWVLYDSTLYDAALYQPGCHYTSGVHYKGEAWQSIDYVGGGPAGAVMFQYRESSDGSTWGAWSALVDAAGDNSQALTEKYFQYRFVFDNFRWDDNTVKFRVKQIY